jgi:hypothetical protein
MAFPTAERFSLVQLDIIKTHPTRRLFVAGCGDRFPPHQLEHPVSVQLKDLRPGRTVTAERRRLPTFHRRGTKV